MAYIRRLIALAIGTAILIGIPYQFGVGFILLSWIPALFAMLYLDE